MFPVIISLLFQLGINYVALGLLEQCVLEVGHLADVVLHVGSFTVFLSITFALTAPTLLILG